MKISTLALLSALAAPATADIYLQEQFNDEVRDPYASEVED